ncbi:MULTISPECIES: 50S ribosomal protein L9 [Caproicibacterium]|jgi:large subunit ribosomal protein L9|uniref:Large ribosomal subunit protein bL9 n=1 Tax=Caproicibacterium lactatifermentans TaxID=2666138 RepID=A0A859DP63_9FIRM|nr:50S ribosomal protein L9 [Caproicibacterium lactatifermentans]ARP50773.1 50S ribosomal protein L9 [Ruminococcaceae bacterium CPB6]MDD4808341.1 50S ribosomal protein L9 [Oscillospiraceae bacterium]QKN23496.1 50S ribosomal protein L9 [Caproicibacterium lactatifermentans]QKO29826.1 50S ribosomal protein L9 [Caproicibacterium lactatifermentans]
MKVVLLQDVRSLGKKGELVNASDGYARNYLLPRSLAKEANAQAMNELKNAEASRAYKTKMEIAAAKAAAAKLEGKSVNMTAKAGKGGKLFGSVTPREIAAAIRQQFGVQVDKRKITLDMEIKAFGTFHCDVKLYNGISAKVSIVVTEA